MTQIRHCTLALFLAAIWLAAGPAGPQAGRFSARRGRTVGALSGGDRVVAVITPQEGGFGGLAGTKVPVGYRPSSGYPPGYSGTNRTQGQVQVAYVKPELAPDRAVGYEIADLVIATSLPSGSLASAQEQALTRWVQAGGTLLVTGGAESSALQSPAMRALLPAQITGTVTLDARSVIRALSASSTLSPPLSPPGQLVATACRP